MKKANKPLDWTAQLVMLRGMTERFGSLHEAQVLQLKLWPFAVDPGLVSSKANVDMEGKLVEFLWEGGAAKRGPKYQARLKTLDGSVKFLLGDGWTTVVKLAGVPIYPVDTKNAKPETDSRKRRNSEKRKRRANRKARR
jgi:hypothetical protein